MGSGMKKSMPGCSYRHPGLDPGSIFIRKWKMWIPGSVHGRTYVVGAQGSA
jgi:hypothetical protein